MEEVRALAALAQEIADCRRCPRLVAYRETVAREKRRAFRDQDYWGRAVPGFGDAQAALLIVGLAPAAHGANRTGRMFTGDRSGDFLMAALYREGFANQPSSENRTDGLQLKDAYLAAAVRCAPPDNKPLPLEIETCEPFLEREMHLLQRTRVVLCLGQLAWNRTRQLLRRMGAPQTTVTFAHGVENRLPAPWPTLVASYHPSQQNTFTGRLTEPMIDAVLQRCRELVGSL